MRLMFILRCLIHAFALIPAAALAQNAGAAVPDAASGLLQMFAGLAVVLSFIIGGLYLLKRLSGPRGAASGLLRVVSATAVGPRERVVMVEVGDTWLVVGVAPGQVRHLHTMERMAMHEPAAGAGDLSGGNFAGRLKKLMERRQNAR